MDSTYQKLQVISQDKEKRLEYEAREKTIRDHNQFLKEADARGEKRGIQIGEKRGAERINRLFALLMENNRYEDMKRSATDSEYQNQLLEEYKL